MDVNKVEKFQDMDIMLSDIFDTIILRTVHPEYVKKIFSKKLKEYYHLPLSSDDLYQMRFDIEAKLCQENQKNGFDLEFNFYSFCQELFDKLQKSNFLVNQSYIDFEIVCKNLEIESEINTQKIDQDIIDIFQEARENNIKIYCLSDFYLPREMILELFKLHKIDQYFEDVFVSSEYLLTKRSGRLYKKILAENFQNKKIIMMGDNRHSDIKMAEENGLDTFWLDRKDQYAYYDYHLKNNQSKKHFEKKIHSLLEDKQIAANPDKIFYQELSFTLYYFISLLYFELVSKGIKDIFLFSREGEFLKKLLDKYFEINNINNIQTHYLIVSRKSTFITSLQSLENEEFETLFRQYRKMSVINFLKSLNFQEDEISRIENSLNMDLNYVEEDLPTSESYRELLNNIDFRIIYENKRIEQKENLKSYIESFGVDIYTEGFVIMDIGWKGTIQDHLFKLYDREVTIKGFYLGLVIDLMPHEKNQKNGLVFDYKKKDIYDKVFQENISLFEVFLGASHGSADHYDMMTDGVVIPVTHEEEEEKIIFNNIIHPIQKVVYKKFTEIANEFKLSHFSILDMKNEVAKIHSRMIYSPTKEEVRFFRNLYHFENFGLFEFSEFNKFQTDSYSKKVKNILKFLRGPKKFLEAGFWKASTLDDIGLLKLYYIYAQYKKFKIFKGKK
jgi:HAD superfamily hydrolase (TIGR01549 family)